MQISISKNKSLKTIQSEFQEGFPFLKIEFYQQSHEIGEGSASKIKLDLDKSIAQVQHFESEGEMNISSDIKVSDLEKQFELQFGLSVQVFRKSGNLWLQTSKTDDWTLEAQNLEGEQMHEKNISDEPSDYHEQA